MANLSLRASPRAPLLPPSLTAFLRRRLIDGLGLAVLGLAGLTALALASYDPADPSLNTAAAADTVANWLGAPGAVFADLALQTLGLAMGLVPVLMAGWALTLLRHRRLPGLAWRLGLAAGALPLAAMALAAIPASPGWPLGTYLGGALGAIGLAALAAGVETLLAAADLPELPLPAALVSAMLSGLAAVSMAAAALGMRPSHLRDALALSIAAFGQALLRLGAAGRWLWLRRPHRLPPRDEELYELEEPADHEDRPAPVLRAPKRRTAAPAAKTPSAKRPAKTTAAEPELPIGGDWHFPALDLLQMPKAGEKLPDHAPEVLRQNAELLMQVLDDFGVKGEIQRIAPGPVVTLYELEPAPGTKSSRVIGLSDDIARSMSAVSVRIAVVPGRNVIGIELPNSRRETVYLRDMFGDAAYAKSGAKLPLALGKTIGGEPVIADLARMPHLLVAGTTGSGKSVSVNTMILSLLYRLPPERCRFIMIDPKMLELSVYDDIPHLLAPVVTEPKKAVVALRWAVREMETRYRAMSRLGVRNIEGYNARIREARKTGEVLVRKVQTGFDTETGKPVYEEQPIPLEELPFIVIVVDEFADLMIVAGKEIEAAVQRLAQMARAAGIHLIMATQRPSVDVITGTIKANFPTRISFQVTSKIDSRTILGESGAEDLLGMGDMLYMAAGGRLTRVHGPFVSDGEVERVVADLRRQGEPAYVDAVTAAEDEDGGFDEADLLGGAFGEGGGNGGSGDALFDQAVALVARERKASTSFIQRHLSIGYNRAAKLIERMEKEGMVGAANHVGKREVLLPPARD